MARKIWRRFVAWLNAPRVGDCYYCGRRAEMGQDPDPMIYGWVDRCKVGEGCLRGA